MAAVNALHPDRKVRGYSQNRGRCATRNWTPPPAAHARPPLLRAFLLNRSPPRKRGSSAFAMFADPAQEELDSRLRGNERRLWFRPHTADSNVKQPTLRRPYCLRPRLGRLPSPLSRGQVSPSPSRGDGAPIGATLLKFAPSCEGAAPLGAPWWRFRIPGPRFLIPAWLLPLRGASSAHRLVAPCSVGNLEQSQSSEAPRRGVVVPPGRVPGPPEYRLTRPIRGRHIDRGVVAPAPERAMPHLRHLPLPAAPSSERLATTPLG
jgi:hypothetical protein